MAQGAPQDFVQLDIPFSNANFFVIPKHMPGRVRVDDYIFFSYPPNMNPDDYMVVVQSLDTSNPSILRTIGPLRVNVELPHVMFDAYSSIFVMPKADPKKPTFYSRLNRGSTYHIQDVFAIHRPGMKHEMVRHGMLSAGVDDSKTAY